MPVNAKPIVSMVLLSAASLAHTASADTISVDSDGSGDYTTIRDAVENASKGDVIIVMPGTYLEDPIFIPNQFLVIQSTGGASATTIKPNDPEATMIVCEDGDLTTLGMSGFTFSSSVSEEPGGAMRISGGAEVQIQNCVFTSNSTTFSGGAVWVDDMSVAQFTECDFIDNHAGKDGGAVAQFGHDQVAFSRCVFRGNSASFLGGGAYIGTSGGVATEGNTPPSFDNCVFYGNSAGIEGGALYIVPTYTAVLYGEAYLDNCTFTGNSAPGNGGIAVSPNHLTDWSGGVAVRNSICWNNQGDPIAFDFENERERSLPQYFYSCSDELTPDSPTSNTSSEPRFTDTAGADGIDATGDEDLRLLPGSPCIDRGFSPFVNSSTDLSGTDRIIDDPTTPNVAGVPPRVDMGAFEFNASDLADLGIAFWIDDSGRLQPFMQGSNWYDALTPDPGLLAILNGFTTTTQLPEIGSDTTIGPLSVTNGNFLFSSGKPEIPPVLTLKEDGSLPVFSDLTVGAYLTQQAPSLILLDLVLSCNDINLMRGSLQTAYAQLQMSGDLIIDGEKAIFACLDGGNIISQDGEHDPDLINLGELIPGGTLNIAGDYQQTGSRIDGTPANGNVTFSLSLPGETINVAGEATLSGGASFFLNTKDLPEVGSQFTILTADEGFGGTMFDFALTTQSADGRFVVLSQTSALGGGESVVATVVDADSLLQNAAVTQSVGLELSDALLVDIDKDGLKDLVLSIDQGPELEGMVAVLLNQGVSGGEWNGFESYGPGTFVINVGIGARGMDYGYANDDEYPDIFVACYNDGTIDVLENTSSESPALLDLSVSLSSDPDLPVGVSSGPLDVWAGDLDGLAGGLSEILVTNELDESVVCYQNLTVIGGGLASSSQISYGNSRKSAPGFLIGSFKPGAGGGVREQGPLGNNGSSQDKNGGIAAGSTDDDDDGALAQAGVGIDLTWTTYDTDEGPTDVATGDLNGDGSPDAVTPNQESDTISILLGGPDKTFQPASNIELGAGFSEPESIAIGDFDGDGDQDVVVICSNLSGNSITLILRNSLVPEGSYGLVVENEQGFVGQQPYLVRSGDVDNDGSDDIIALTQNTTLAGGGTYGFGTSSVEVNSCPGDFDGDGSIGGPDLAQLLGAWGNKGSAYDIDGDGAVDGFDLTIILAGWGPCPGTGSFVD